MRHLIPVRGRLQRVKTLAETAVCFPAPGRNDRVSDQAPEGALRNRWVGRCSRVYQQGIGTSYRLLKSTPVTAVLRPRNMPVNFPARLDRRIATSQPARLPRREERRER